MQPARGRLRSLHRTLVDSSTVGGSNSPPSGSARLARPAPAVYPRSPPSDTTSRRWLCGRGLVRSIAHVEARPRGVPAWIGVARRGRPGRCRGRGHPDDAIPGDRGRSRLEPELRHHGHDGRGRPGRPRRRQGARRLDGGPAWRRLHHRWRRIAGRHRRRPRSRLNVTVPADATATTQRIDVRGTTEGASTTLSVDIRVTPNAAGNVTLTTDTPQVKGASNASFSFTLTLTNDTPEDLPFSVAATGPAGWTVTGPGRDHRAGRQRRRQGRQQRRRSRSPPRPPTATAAGTYPIAVDATSGSQTAHADLSVEITGSYSLTLTTSDQRLNMNATAGHRQRPDAHRLTNTGTADVAGVAMTASAPTGWTVKFDPTPVDVPANQHGPGRGPRHAIGRRHRGRLRRPRSRPPRRKRTPRLTSA